MNIYLAGGMRSNWQDQVIEAFKGENEINFFDPRTHSLTDPIEYTKWDLDHVKKCDVVLAYMEKDNPSGAGLCLEIGYAKALDNKMILFVDEVPDNKYFGMVRACAWAVFTDLDEAIETIKNKLNLVKSISYMKF